MSATSKESGIPLQSGATAAGRRRAFGAAVVVALVLFATGAILLTVSWTGVREKLLVSNWLFLVSGSAAALCCLYTTWRTTGALRRAWALFAAMGAAWTIGNVVWFVQSLQPVKPFPTVSDLFFVVALVLVVQQLEGNVLQPMLVGRTLDLHPAVVILAVTAGGSLQGIAGAFLSVPIVSVLAVLVRYVREALGDPRPAPVEEPA